MADNRRLIELDALIDNIDWDNDIKKWTLRGEPEDIPTVDAVEVVHGEWRYYSTTMQECSNCHRHTARHKFKYCPHCGAVMEDRCYESTD